MKNITVSVPDELYQRARIKAAENNTTVTAVVRDILVKFATEDDRTAQLMTAIENARTWQRDHGVSYSAGERLTREELYEEAFRRHERAPLQRK